MHDAKLVCYLPCFAAPCSILCIFHSPIRLHTQGEVYAPNDELEAAATEDREHFRTLLEKAVQRSVVAESADDSAWAIAAQCESVEAPADSEDVIPSPQLSATASLAEVRMC